MSTVDSLSEADQVASLGKNDASGRGLLPAHRGGAPGYDGMLVVDRSGNVTPLGKSQGNAWQVPLGGKTVPLNQRFSRMWRLPRALLDRIGVENGLRRALGHGELVLHFQPQASLETGQVNCVEALVRWQHPSRGLLWPEDFIPMAEETGVIVPLGEWVMRAACVQACDWRRQGLQPLRVAVNVSARQLEQHDLVDMVARVLDETGLEPGSLELEITESVTMRDIALAVRVLRDLRVLGVRLSMDDFGAGYSSFAHLKDLPMDVLKIDRSLVTGINRERNHAAITAAIIAMARSLGLEVVAEGVETTAQLEILRQQKCDRFQGYLLSEPKPADSLEGMLSGHNEAQAA